MPGSGTAFSKTFSVSLKDALLEGDLQFFVAFFKPSESRSYPCIDQRQRLHLRASAALAARPPKVPSCRRGGVDLPRLARAAKIYLLRAWNSWLAA